jgi:hypothetical protein
VIPNLIRNNEENLENLKKGYKQNDRYQFKKV